MPHCNRVRPNGDIVADATRGLFMGNRGRLHDAEGGIRRRWQTRRWICCTTSFRGRRVPIMAERGYTVLFFLDEATSLAAGHRPCAECRRRDFNSFIDAWRPGNGPTVGRIYVDRVDRILHAQRTAPPASVQAVDLVDGALVSTVQGQAYLFWRGRFHRWTPRGYDKAVDRLDRALSLLTPPATLATLQQGYRPVVHPSVESPV